MRTYFEGPNYKKDDVLESERIDARERVGELGCEEVWEKSPLPPIRDPDDFTSEEETKPSIHRKSDSKKQKKKKKKKGKRRHSNSNSDVSEFDPDEDDEWVEVEAQINQNINTTNEEMPVFMQEGHDQTA